MSLICLRKYGFTTLIIGLFCFACSAPQNQKLTGIKVLLPWDVNNRGDYKLTTVLIKTLPSPYQLQGDVAKIHIAERNSLPESVARPKLIYSGGVYTPQDATSSIAIALYAHMERIANLDQTLSVQQHLNWPRRVVLDVALSTESGDTLENNAWYVQEMDLIGFSPYTEPNIPLAVNGGVLAHEHFHGYFHHLVMGPVQESEKLTPDQPLSALDYNVRVLRALNEGLADFYGFVYSQNPQYMESSLNQRSIYRRLNDSPRFIPEPNALSEQFVNPQQVGCGQNFLCASYFHGVSVSRFFYRWAQLKSADNPQAAQQVLGEIFKLLPVLASEIAQTIKSEPLDLAWFIEKFVKGQGQQMTAEQCGLLNMVLGKERMHKGASSCQ